MKNEERRCKEEEVKKQVAALSGLDEASEEADGMRRKALEKLQEGNERERQERFPDALDAFQTSLDLLERADALDPAKAPEGIPSLRGMMGELTRKMERRTEGKYGDLMRQLRSRVDMLRNALGMSGRYETEEKYEPIRDVRRESNGERREQPVGGAAPEKKEDVRVDVKNPSEIHYGLSDVKGQDEAVRMLMAFAAQHRVFVHGADHSQRTLEKSAVLLYGPPGTGKTMLAEAIAKDMSVPILSIDPRIFKKYVGESEALMQGIMDKARELGTCVVLIDEFDRMFAKEADEVGDHVGGKVGSVMMTNLQNIQDDGMRGANNIIVVATTNHPDKIETAHVRRLGKKVFIDLPGPEGRAQILAGEIDTNQHLSYVSEYYRERELQDLVDMTEGWTADECKKVPREAANVLNTLPVDAVFQLERPGVWRYPRSESYEGETTTYGEWFHNKKDTELETDPITVERFLEVMQKYEPTTREEDVASMRSVFDA